MGNLPYLDLLAKHGIGSAHPGGLVLTRELLSREFMTENTTLLDIGCGTGQTSSYIARNYPCSITAADINPVMLQRAAQRFQAEGHRIKLVLADARQMPFPSNSFDIVLAESVTLFTTLSKSIKEYFRVSRPGGTLLDIELTAEQPFSSGEMREVKEVLGIEQIPTPDEWHRLFRYSGFSKIDIYKGIPLPHAELLSPSMYNDFMPYLFFMNRYQRKLGYRIFRCRI